MGVDLTPDSSRLRAAIRGSLLILLLLDAPTAARAQEAPPANWVGKQVVPKEKGFALKDDGGVVAGSLARIEIYRVEKVEANRLRLHAPGLSGWALPEEVVPVDQAVAHYTGEIRDHPDDPHGYTMRATILHRVKDDLDAALRDYDEAVKLAPTASYVYNNRGNARMSRRDLDGAIADYTEALRIDPANAIARTNRGRARLAKREFDRAIADLDAALSIEAGEVGALVTRGDAYRAKKDPGRAIADYDAAIQVDPRTIGALLGRGQARLDRKEFDPAIADFDAAIRVDPKLAPSYNGRGHARYTKKEYDLALADFAEALKLDPKSVQTRVNRALVYRAKGETDRALADYDEAIKIDPKSVYSFNNRGVVRQDRKDYDGAVADFDAAILSDPKYGRPYRNRAVIALVAGRDGAERDARAAIACDGWWSESAVYAVLIGHFGARRIGQEDAAKRLLDDAFQKCDDSAWPYPVVRFLRREIDEDALLALAIDDDKRTEVHCYIALDQILSGRPGPARDHLDWVKAHGTRSFMEYAIAVAELDRMAAKAKP